MGYSKAAQGFDLGEMGLCDQGFVSVQSRVEDGRSPTERCLPDRIH